MALWLIRSGIHGEYEARFFEEVTCPPRSTLPRLEDQS